MKLLITTVADGDPSSRQDVVLSADAATPVRDAAKHLARLRADDPASVPDKAPVCYLCDDPLSPGAPLAGTPVMDGSVVDLGAPVPRADAEYGPQPDPHGPPAGRQADVAAGRLAAQPAWPSTGESSGATCAVRLPGMPDVTWDIHICPRCG
ncbi:hypothetical protein H1V43_32705 [Streptomyces sp. PSKA54]|uniref:Uncharacterized protein n=1 Tax=Streptomyces himalayensis subsp. aureolus TaxID=2758039 RepID=A0A7W2D752_9ACTN|nr:hypothetical protein [Streptomyces himalayensis]MBA4866013.1 hypothetical protein [Streptomyces himalayensis subsp. aureolus]